VSRKPGPQSHDPHSPLWPARTPGTLGVRDAAEPGALAKLGDTPGPLGWNDGAALHASGRWRVVKSQVILSAETTLP
jgi:hypothetical protein